MSNFSTNNHNLSQPSKRSRRVFSDEFKRDAVNLVVKEGYPAMRRLIDFCFVR